MVKISQTKKLLCCKPNNWLSFLHCLTIFVPFLPYFALIQARNPRQTRFLASGNCISNRKPDQTSIRCSEP